MECHYLVCSKNQGGICTAEEICPNFIPIDYEPIFTNYYGSFDDINQTAVKEREERRKKEDEETPQE